MKDKIIMLVVGIIIGVVLAGVCFWFATTITGNGKGNMPDDMQRGGSMKQEQKFEQKGNTLNTENSTDSNS